jgi:hypothetical protein
MRHKDFVMWPEVSILAPTAAYAMKKDPASTKFWLELTGLATPATYTYQYGW